MNREQHEDPDVQHEIRDRDVIYALRTVHQNQTQLVILADQKANVLIGIVAGVLTFLLSKTHFLTWVENKFFISCAGFVLLEGMALIFALLALTPKTPKPLQILKIEDMSNPLFFGQFTKFSADDYVAYLTTILNDDRSARHHLAKDLYYVGVVLKKKYLLLNYAYSFALMGVVFLLSSSTVFFFLG